MWWTYVYFKAISTRLRGVRGTEIKVGAGAQESEIID